MLEGEATVGPEGGGTVDLQPGDLASFPPGLLMNSYSLVFDN